MLGAYPDELKAEIFWIPYVVIDIFLEKPGRHVNRIAAGQFRTSEYFFGGRGSILE